MSVEIDQALFGGDTKVADLIGQLVVTGVDFVQQFRVGVAVLVRETVEERRAVARQRRRGWQL